MSTDPTTRVTPPPPRTEQAAGHGGSTAAPQVGVVTAHGQPGLYIYPFWQRTEFWVMALTSLAIAIAAAADEGFDARGAWTLITVLGAAYILSRGLAKREDRPDDGDRTWTP